MDHGLSYLSSKQTIICHSHFPSSKGDGFGNMNIRIHTYISKSYCYCLYTTHSPSSRPIPTNIHAQYSLTHTRIYTHAPKHTSRQALETETNKCHVRCKRHLRPKASRRKRFLLPKASIQKREIILREYDGFCVHIFWIQKRNQITKISYSPRHLDVYKSPPPPPIKEAAQKNEKQKKITKMPKNEIYQG